MNTIDAITLETPDLAAAQTFYSSAFGLGDRIRLRHSDAATTGFRGYTLSLITAQPADAQLLFDDAVAAGASVVKPAAKSLWGFGGAVKSPDGAIWNIATSSRKDSSPATRTIQQVVLLLGAVDVKTSRAHYAAQGFATRKSMGGYTEFETAPGSIGLGLYKRPALAKSVGVPADGDGAHRIAIHGSVDPGTDPDGFAWEPVSA